MAWYGLVFIRLSSCKLRGRSITTQPSDKSGISSTTSRSGIDDCSPQIAHLARRQRALPVNYVTTYHLTRLFCTPSFIYMSPSLSSASAESISERYHHPLFVQHLSLATCNVHVERERWWIIHSSEWSTIAPSTIIANQSGENRWPNLEL